MKYFIYIICLFFIFSCDSNKKYLEDIAIEWNNKEILFPDTFYFSKTLYDTINYDINTPFKVFYYVDSTGCSSCKLKINGWYELQYLFDDLFHGNCKSVIVFEPKNAIQILEISTQIHVSGTDNGYILDTCGFKSEKNTEEIDNSVLKKIQAKDPDFSKSTFCSRAKKAFKFKTES